MGHCPLLGSVTRCSAWRFGEKTVEYCSDTHGSWLWILSGILHNYMPLSLPPYLANVRTWLLGYRASADYHEPRCTYLIEHVLSVSTVSHAFQFASLFYRYMKQTTSNVLAIVSMSTNECRAGWYHIIHLPHNKPPLPSSP
jgi:hypothetical protein